MDAGAHQSKADLILNIPLCQFFALAMEKVKMKDHLDSTNTLKTNSQKTPLKAIREKCLDCCGYQYSEVRECHITDCPLWIYRMGKNPNHGRIMTDEQKQAATLRLKRKENQ
jgi:hypothetical protein